MDSASDAIVQEKKKPEELVKWNEYEALRDTLYKRIDAAVEKSDDSLREELNTLDLKIEDRASQQSVDVLQEAVNNLTRQITNLATMVQQGQVPPNAHNAANLQGGCGVVAARRVPLEINREDDGLGKPKFSIPTLPCDTEEIGRAHV